MIKTLKTIHRKGDEIEAWMFSKRVLGIAFYWWFIAISIAIIVSGLMLIDAIQYENQAQLI